MPFSNHLGVSRRIEDPEERERLREAISSATVAEDGFIVRTAAEGEEAEILHREAQLLEQLWLDVKQRGSSGATPRLVFEDLDLLLRLTL